MVGSERGSKRCVCVQSCQSTGSGTWRLTRQLSHFGSILLQLKFRFNFMDVREFWSKLSCACCSQPTLCSTQKGLGHWARSLRSSSISAELIRPNYFQKATCLWNKKHKKWMNRMVLCLKQIMSPILREAPCSRPRALVSSGRWLVCKQNCWPTGVLNTQENTPYPHRTGPLNTKPFQRSNFWNSWPFAWEKAFKKFATPPEAGMSWTCKVDSAALLSCLRAENLWADSCDAPLHQSINDC